MAEIASRDLRNDTRGVLARVEAGETVTITVSGRPVAEIVGLARRPRWTSRRDFAAGLGRHRADPGLRTDLEALTAAETTADLPW